MFCNKCGNEIRDGVAFCPKCGAPIKYRNTEVQNRENDESNGRGATQYTPPVQTSGISAPAASKPKKKGTWIVVLILLLAAGAGAYFYFFGSKTKIDLNDYLEVTFDEYGSIDARVGFAVRKLMKDYAKVLTVTDKNKAELRDYFLETYYKDLKIDAMVDMAVSADIVTAKLNFDEDRTEDEALLELFLIAALADSEAPGGSYSLYPEDHFEPEMKKGKLDKSKKLNEGETISFSWGKIDSQKVEELFKVKLIWSNTSFKVETKGSAPSEEETKTPETSAETKEQPTETSEPTTAVPTTEAPTEAPTEASTEAPTEPAKAVNTITFEANGGNVEESRRKVEVGEKYGTLPVAARFGYAFEGWYTSTDGGKRAEASSIMGEKNVTLYARWTKLNNLKGLRVSFGRYEQDNDSKNGKEEIIWEVFTWNDDVVWLISEQILDAKPYNYAGGETNWPNCSLRYWLNDTFMYEAFSDREVAGLVRLDVDGDWNPLRPYVDPGETVDDYIAILSLYEVKKYYTNETQVRCEGTEYAKANGLVVADNGYSPYWTRTPGIDGYLAVIARSAGDFNEEGREIVTRFGVRPVICVKRSAFE